MSSPMASTTVTVLQDNTIQLTCLHPWPVLQLQYYSYSTTVTVLLVLVFFNAVILVWLANYCYLGTYYIVFTAI